MPPSITVISSSRRTYALAPMSGTRWTRAATSVLDERGDVIARELVAAFERGELYQERKPDDLAFQLLHELDGARNRAAGGEEIIDDEHTSSRLDRILVHLEGRRAVLEVVLHADHVGRQLAELADRHEPDAELVGDRSREDEAAGLHADDGVDLLVADLREEPVDCGRERIAVLEESGDVLEEDPRLRKIGDVADTAPEILRLHGHGAQISVSPK